MPSRIALVTGANRGIGAQVALDLGAAGYDVRVASRRIASAQGVVDRIVAAGGVARGVGLDVTSEQDILRVASELESLDVLVNNAGVMLDGFDHGIVIRTLGVNFEGPRALTRALWGALRPGSRVVNVSSGLADEDGLPAPLRERFEGVETEAQVAALIDEYAVSVARGYHTRTGWPSSAYRVSKLGLNALTRVWARQAEAEGRGIVVDAVCPGWVRTEMGGRSAPRSVAEGADTVVWLATGGAGAIGGGYYRDRAVAIW